MLKNILHFFCLIIFHTCINPAFSFGPWENPEWKRLLHYKSKMSGHIKGEADGPLFYFSPEGKTSPELEYKASLKAFQKAKIETSFYESRKMHPQCAFPARFQWIKEQENINFPQIECKDFQWWKNKLKAKSISLIYSSAYPNNPASTFGHTILRINSDSFNKSRISDYAVGFVAMTDGSKGIGYAIKGLFGGYQGQFTMMPYYRKINEYTNGESRDLWEYHLKLDQNQVDRLVAHLWELRINTYFDYYFMHENCSYQLLTLLEVANFEWKLTDGFFFYALPTDTVKKIEREGGIVGHSFRPSHKKKMLASRTHLNEKQNNIYENLITNKIKPTSVGDPHILDATISYLRYKNFSEKNTNQSTKQQLRSNLLARSKLGNKNSHLVSSQYYQQFETENPLKSHNSYAFQFGGGSDNNLGLSYDLIFRMGLHDISNNDRGSLPHLHVEFFKTHLKTNQSFNKVYLDQLVIFDILSLVPLKAFDFNISWQFKTSFQKTKDLAANNFIVKNFEGGAGIDFEIVSSFIHFYTLLKSFINYSGALPKNFRFGPAMEAGLLIMANEKIKINGNHKSYYDINNNFNNSMREEWSLENSYMISKNLDARLQLSLISSSLNEKDFNSINSKISYYF